MRKRILESFDILEIALLPGGVFCSQADSCVLMLRKRAKGEGNTRLTATVREVRSKDLARFIKGPNFTRTYPAYPREWEADPEMKFTVSPLRDLWKKLGERPRRPFAEVADVRNGIKVETADKTSVSKRRSAVGGRAAVRYAVRPRVLRPFVLLPSPDEQQEGEDYQWLRYGPHLHRPREKPFHEGAKVLINATRSAGSVWRLVAAPGPPGLYFSDRFHGIVPKTADVSHEQIMAVLNGPLANAWFDAHCRSRKVVIKRLNRLPFPKFDEESAKLLNDKVARLAQAARTKWRQTQEGLFYDGMVDTTDTALLLDEIDQMVYDAYGLTDFERRQVDKLMNSDTRPS